MGKSDEEGYPEYKAELEFVDDNGRKHYWTPKFLREDISYAELERIAEEMADLGIFQKKGVAYSGPLTRFRNRRTLKTILFDIESCHP